MSSLPRGRTFRSKALAERRKAPDSETLPPPPPPEVGDADLVRDAIAGDEDAFVGLVARYHRRAFWIAFYVVGNVEDARDVVQESFVRVHRSLARYDFARSFYTWFYRIVVNLAIDALRRRKSYGVGRRETLVEDQLWVEGDGLAERNEVRALVWQVLDGLDSKFKSVLVLRDIHGLSCREIAPILNVTHATVRWRLHRGRKLFRACWERMAVDEPR